MANSTALVSHPMSRRNLLRTIFRSDNPEQMVRALPAQSLYLAIRESGLASAYEVVQLLSVDQMKVMLDFDCWNGDVFVEEQLWDWIALSDGDDGLVILQRILKAIDLKIVSLMIARHIQVYSAEEPSDTPPGPGFYTPDRGRTWIQINIEENNQHRLMGKFLALLFENSRDLFYQLIAIAHNNTPILLEEESYLEKTRRLSIEGFPDAEFATRIHTPISEIELRKILERGEKCDVVSDIAIIEPIVYEHFGIEPLGSLMREMGHDESLHAELTLLTNAAFGHFRTPLFDSEESAHFLAQVRGALNIGLESALTFYMKGSLRNLCQLLGLRTLYAHGLAKLFKIRALANSLAKQHSNERAAELELLLEHCGKLFPAMPISLNPDGSWHAEDGKLASTARAIEHLSEIEILQRMLSPPPMSRMTSV